MKKKTDVNPKLVAAFAATPPRTPALSAADATYLRGLRRRGYTLQEIIEVGTKAGFVVPDNIFDAKKKKPATTTQAPVRQTAPVQGQAVQRQPESSAATQLFTPQRT